MLYLAALQVQSELKRRWRCLRLKRYIGRDYRLNSSSISRSGTENMTQFHRNSRAQSFLQTETTVVWDIQRWRSTNHAFTSLPLVNNSVFSKSFTLKRTRLSEAWDWHAGDTMRIQHLWGTTLYFSIQRKLSFHSKFSYKPPKWH